MVTISPSDPIQGAMVCSPQIIDCIMSTVSGVESSSVMISWMGPGGSSITSDGRVTISPTTSSGNTYTSSLQFDYLMEGDNGTYTCSVTILDIGASRSIDIQTLFGKWIANFVKRGTCQPKNTWLRIACVCKLCLYSPYRLC